MPASARAEQSTFPIAVDSHGCGEGTAASFADGLCYPNLASAEDQEWTGDERASSCDLFDQGRLRTGRTAQSELNQRVDTRTPEKMGRASANATPRKPLEESSTEDAGVRSSPATLSMRTIKLNSVLERCSMRVSNKRVNCAHQRLHHTTRFIERC